jgi:Flp pilus assembly protein TadG
LSLSKLWLGSKGSAAVDFVLISAPLVLLSLSVLGVALFGLVRNVMFDSAIEGARFAALADQNSRAGCFRAQALFTESLGSALKPVFQCEQTLIGSRSVMFVSIEAAIPGLGFLPNDYRFRAVAHATCEIQ